MNKEKIIAAVIAKLGKSQVSDKTIEAVIALIPLEDGKEADDAYIDKIKTVCESIQGNINSVASQSVKDAKAEWEKNRKQDPKPDPKKDDDTDPKPDEDETVKGLMERIAALEALGKENNTRRKVDDIRNGIKGKETDLRVTNKALWRDVVEGLDIKEDSVLDDVLTKAKESYEGKLKDYVGEGASPYGSADDPDQTVNKTNIDNFFAQMKSEGRF